MMMMFTLSSPASNIETQSQIIIRTTSTEYVTVYSVRSITCNITWWAKLKQPFCRGYNEHDTYSYDTRGRDILIRIVLRT